MASASISVCVMDFICTILPTTDGSYTGHGETGDGNRVEDADLVLMRMQTLNWDLVKK